MLKFKKKGLISFAKNGTSNSHHVASFFDSNFVITTHSHRNNCEVFIEFKVVTFKNLKIIVQSSEFILNLLFIVCECRDRKSTRLNSSHVRISYAVFCLKKNRYNNSVETII